MILVDMDGVLCDFMGPAVRLHDFDAEKVQSEWPSGEFDVCKVLGIAPMKFWERIDRQGFRFWESLPEYQWTQELIGIVNCHEFVIASCPSWSPDSSSGKVGWLHKKFGRSFRAYMLGQRKELLAGPGRVLIDDNEDNCRKFVMAGGDAILFPRPWNRLAGITDPMTHVVKELAKCHP